MKARRTRTGIRSRPEPLEARIVPAAGLFDPGFGGGDGIAQVQFEVDGLHDDFNAVVRQADGKLIAVGATADFGSRFSPDIAVARFNADGSLDATFGTDGKVKLDFGGVYHSRETGYAVALDAGGNIVIAGSANVAATDVASTDFFVARLTSAGVLDTTFGGTGFVLTDFGSPTEEARGVAVQGDGMIVVAGTSGGDIALARFTPLGALDTGFDTDGKVTTNAGGGGDQGRAVALQADGKIVVAGTNGADFVAVRYTTAGALDAGFGTAGIARVDLGGSGESANALGIDSLGRIVLGGTKFFDVAVARLDDAGALDVTFGTGGSLVYDAGNNYGRGNALSVISDDSVVLVGDIDSLDVFALKLTDAGVLDAAFGTAGFARVTQPSTQYAAASLALADGSVIVTGTHFGAVDRDGLIVKLTPTGALDTTFAGGGFSLTGFFREAPVQVLAGLLLPDGKYVVAGENGLGDTRKDGLLARFNADGTLDTSFGANGRVSLSIDLAERIAALAFDATTNTLIAGAFTTYGPPGADLLIARYDVSGALVPTFGTGGIAQLHFGGSETVTSLAVAPDGKIVIGASLRNYAGTQGGAGIVRLNASGMPDTTFDGDGVLTFPQFTGGSVTGLAPLADGRLVAAANGSGAAFVRLSAGGLLDATFGGDGIVELGAGRGIGGMIVEADGTITFSGVTTVGSEIVADFRRLLPDGADDPTFGFTPMANSSGVQVRPGSPFFIDSSNRIVTTGRGGGAPGLLRLNFDGTRDFTFGEGGFAAGAGVIGLAERADGRIVSALTGPGGLFGKTFQVTQLLDDPESSPNGVFRIDGYEFFVRENQGPVQIVVKRVGGSLGAVSVDFTTVAGTALAGDDFTAMSGTLMFADGDIEETITIPLTVDSIGENTEQFRVVLSNAQGGALLDNPRTALVTIPLHLGPSGGRDSGYGDLGFGSGTAIEAGNGFEPVLDIGRDAQGRVLVFGSASASNVFGQMAARFLPDGTLDTTFGGDGTVFADLTGLGAEIIKGLILPDGKILAVSKTIESPTGTNTGATAVIGFTRYLENGNIDRTFGDNGFITTDLPMTAQDTVRDAALLADGKVLVAVESRTINEDATVFKDRARVLRFHADGTLDTSFGTGGIAQTPEAEETDPASFVVLGDGDIVLAHSSREVGNSRTNFGLTRFNADGSVDTAFGTGGVVSLNTAANASERPVRLLVQPDGKLVVAANDDQLGRQVVVRLDAATGALDPSFDGDGIAFGPSGVSPADALVLPSGRIVVFGTGGSASRVLTQYNADGSLDGTFGIGGSVAIGTGQPQGQGVGRILLEPDNAVLAAFDARFASDPGTHTHVTLTRIFTEPRVGKFSFNEAAAELDENGGSIELNIIRTDGSDTDVTVNYTFANGTAGAADFTGVNGALTFLAGETLKTITIPILDDTLAEGRESFTVTLSGAPLGAAPVSTVTIFDGPGVFAFTAPQFVTAEGLTTITIPVTRTAGSDGTATVRYSFADGTAVLGEDYVGTPGVVTFADRQMVGVFTAYIRNDSLVEGRENFTATLSAPTGGATLGALTTAEITIFDSEPASGAGAGSLDRTFGTDGVSRIDVFAGTDERSYDVATLPDGRVLAVGETGGTGASDFLLVRYTATGALDPTWGAGGIVTVDLGGYDVARSVLITSDGGVLVAGYSLVEGEGDFAIAKLNADGTPDTGFSLDGKLTIDFAQQDDRAVDMVLQSDGKIVLGGSSGSALGRDFAAARLNSDGSLDTAFSGDGRATVDFEGRFDVGWSVAVDSKGRIVMTGDSIVTNTGPGGFTLSPSQSNRAATMRLLADGTLDVSFSTDGKVLDATNDPANSQMRKVLIRPDDSIVCLGIASANFLKFEYAEAGFANLDIAYSQGPGVVTVNFPRVGASGGNGFDQALDALFTPDGSLFVGGWSGLSSSFLDGDLAFAKFNDHGALDGRFAVKGIGFLESAPSGQAIALTAKGDLVAVGPGFEITRVLGKSVAPLQGVFQLNTLGVAVEETTPSITFVVDRPRDASAGQVSVSYTTIGGSALAGVDFVPVSGTLAFEDGETQKTFTVPIINDTQRELLEQFTVLLFGATGGATLSSFRSATVTINASDPTASFGSFPKTVGVGGGTGFDFVSESSGFAFLYVERSSGLGTVTIDYATVDGTAKAGEDYTPVTGTVTLGPGVTTFNFAITVPITQDSDIEGAEDFFIEFSNPTGGAGLEGSFGTRRIVIPDNDPLEHLNAGRLDTTFDTNGRLNTSFDATGPESAYAVARDAAGKLVVVGQAGSNTGIAIARYNDDGSLDTTFSGDGKAVVDLGTAGERALNLNIRPDGKILVFARVSAPPGVTNASAAVVRLNADGTLDTSFDGDGIATLALTAPITFVDVESGADGKFVVTGHQSSGVDLDLAVLRFTADGTLDTTFSGDGMRTFDFGTSTDVPYGLALQADGKILIAAQAQDLTFGDDRDNDRTIRLNANGTLDTTFANGGTFSARIMEFLYPGDPDASGSTFYSGVAVQPDGKIVLAGQHSARDVPSLQFPTSFRFGEIVTRLNANGTLDTTFAGTGHTFIEAPADPVASYQPLSLFSPGIAFDTDGKIYVRGTAGGSGLVAVARLLSDGRMDIGFGKGGVQALATFAGENFASSQDILVQPDGRVVLVGSTDFASSLATSDTALVRFIGGPDSGDFRLRSSAYKVAEDGGSLIVGIERVTGFDGAASVTLTQEDGTALAGLDYTLTTQTLTWGAFEAGVKTVTIPILNDALAQGDLTFTVKLTNPTNGSELSPVNSATATIIDDENMGEFNFRIGNYRADENGGMATITVDRLKGKGGIVTVDYAATAGGTPATGTATAADFTAVNGTLTFGDGITTQSFTVPLLDDGVLDFDKSVKLALSGNSAGTALGAANARLTIVDDERPTGGVFDFSAAETIASEDSTGVLITITRTGGMGEATVVFTAAPGTATALDDYGPVSGTLLFEAGVVSQQVFIPIFEDALAEGDETIALTLSDPTGDLVVTTRVTPTLGLANATVRIVDNDPAPLVVDGGFLEFAVNSFADSEEKGRVQLFVTRIGGMTGAATVDIQFTPGTASAGDFTAATIAVLFEDGQQVAVVNVPVRNDLLGEGDQGFTATLANPGGSAFLGDRTNANVTILDDETLPLRDFNNDGKLDLIAQKGSSKLLLHLGDGAGGFALVGTLLPKVKGVKGFVVGDFNGDGNSDLVLATKKAVVLLAGNGDGTFDAPVAFASNKSSKSLLAADFNGDGRLDVAALASKGVNVLLNNGSGFDTPLFTPALKTLTIVSGDFNEDGSTDLAIVSKGKSNVSALINDGVGNFAAAVGTQFFGKGVKAASVVAADLNGDGHIDIAAIVAKNQLAIAPGNGLGGFGPAASTAVGKGAKLLVLADADDDLDYDLIATNAKKLAVLLANNGVSGFSAPVPINVAFKPTFFTAVDLNGDEDADLVLATKKDKFRTALGAAGTTFAV
ncbi:MAG: Calx-beta domain-containing protein [Chthoniobacteraceae bacterium]